MPVDSGDLFASIALMPDNDSEYFNFPVYWRDKEYRVDAENPEKQINVGVIGSNFLSGKVLLLDFAKEVYKDAISLIENKLHKEEPEDFAEYIECLINIQFNL